MPIQFTSGSAKAVSQTNIVLTNHLGRRRDVSALAQTYSQTTFSYVGRDRAINLNQINSTSRANGTPIRIRNGIAKAIAVSQSICNKLTVTPGIPAPSGKLTLNGFPVKGARLLKGASYTFGFTIAGNRLAGLIVTLTFTELGGREALRKTVRVDPGGVVVDQDLAQSDGSEIVTGYIIVPYNDTLFIGTSPEYELRYLLEIGNTTIRKHFIEDDYVTFVNHNYTS
jgi:hypothetical protein